MKKQTPSSCFWLLLALCLSPLTGLAQQMTFRGNVNCAETGEKLPDVFVKVEGSNTSTITDAEGAYDLQVIQNFFATDPKLRLVFSAPGYDTLKVDTKGRLRINVELQPNGTLIYNSIFSGTADGQNERELTFAVTCLDEKALTRVPFAAFGQGLQGKVPGLRVVRAGDQPGDDTWFQIRGANSIANGQRPLIIMDGIYLSQATLADIHPEDIEKVEILKGAAGAALYGSQAANGVIQIFTRRGKNLKIGQTNIIYQGEFGLSENTARLPINEFTNREVLQSSGPQPILGDPTIDNIHQIALPNYQDYQENLLFTQGAYQSHYIGVEGRGLSTDFLASFQRLDDEGILAANDGYQRNSFRLNLDHRLNNKLDFQFSALYASAQQNLLDTHANGTGTLLSNALMLTPIFNLEVPNEEDGSAYDWDIDNTGYGITNPLYLQYAAQQQVNRNRLMGSFAARYQVREWLSLIYNAALDRSGNEYTYFLEKGFLSTSVPGFFHSEATAVSGLSQGGGLHRSNRITQSFISRADAIVRKKITGLNLAARASFLYESLDSRYNEAIGENLLIENIPSLDNISGPIRVASEQQEAVAYSTWLVADADYKNKYIFSALFRQEETSLFGPKENASQYYRLSTAYRLTEDVKLKPFKELKIRAAMGTAGIRPNFEQRFETYRLINGQIEKFSLGNESLLPAESTEIELGLDATFLKAFRLEASYALVSTENQILLAPLSGATDFVGQWQNAGKVEATVYEGALNIDFAKLFRIGNGDFKWDLMSTFTRVEQNLARLDIPAYTTGPGLMHTQFFQIQEGLPLGAMLGEVFITTPEQIFEQEDLDPRDYTLNDLGYMVHIDQLGTPDESPLKMIDENGNPVLQIIGDANPDFRMGFANTISFRGLELYALLDWKQGGDVYNLTRQWLYRDERHADYSANGISAGFYQSLFNGGAANNHFVEDGTFMTLREASLSYTFHKIGFLKAFERLRLSLIGKNLLTWTDYSGYHPDVSIAPRGENVLSDRVLGGLGSDFSTPYGDPTLFAVDAFNYPLRTTVSFRVQAIF